MSRSLIPNFTQIPDVMLDEWMRVLDGAEFKIVSFVARKTFGWGKTFDRISLSQMEAGTGLARSTVQAACASLEKRGMLRVDHAGGRQANAYKLNLEYECPDCTENPTSTKIGIGRKSVPTVPKIEPPTSTKIGNTIDTERDTKQETVPQTPKKASTPRGSAPLSEAVRQFHERRIAVKGRAPCRDARLEARCDRLLRDNGPEAFCRALDGYFGCLGGTDLYPEQVGYELATFVRQFDRWESGAREFIAPVKPRASSPSQPAEQFQPQQTAADWRRAVIAAGGADPMSDRRTPR